MFYEAGAAVYSHFHHIHLQQKLVEDDLGSSQTGAVKDLLFVDRIKKASALGRSLVMGKS